MPDAGRLVAGLLLSGLIGALAYWRGSLTAGGWLGAVLVGTVTVAWGGWSWGALVVLFFVSSSALSHWRRAAKAALAADKFAKHERRDLLQVLANGGVTALCALLFGLNHATWLWLAGLGALATATADTWATEVGTLSRRPPRLITNGRVAPPGTSGAVTRLGWGASLAGAATIALGALVASRATGQAGGLVDMLALLLGGLAGALADSLLGATWQMVRWCPHCGSATERAVHRCGTPTTHLRGWRWLDNDLVNLLATGVGALVSAVLGVVLLPA
ncbi:DUF92 domain-containing protein [Kallotenue papyrolyticum]|uniref:DUF92 domain-containing protein n=1 Tax=Kallotenue papyrolyticum TaxID=1325125 RepID=UPI000478629E|nr:DUF92 domain-containing protein [Kallotenue papyrolyticum]